MSRMQAARVPAGVQLSSMRIIKIDDPCVSKPLPGRGADRQNGAGVLRADA